MNIKQIYFPNNLKLANNNNYGENGSDKLLGGAENIAIANADMASKNKIMSQMHQMKELNASLEHLVEHLSKEITEAAATNSKFISIIAHDLRSPFCSILGALELLKEKLGHTNTDMDTYINLASDSATRTLDLLDNLLAWTVSQNKEKTFNPVKINLRELFIGEMENINTSALQKQIKMTHTIAPDLNVSADLQMLKTIIRNLFSNAIKYTNIGGEIIVSALESKSYVEISIQDNGIGISPAAKEKLFKSEEFHSTPGTNREKGTGLGLSLCKEFVELHGGEIWIESKLDKGSEFKFTIPHYL